MRQSLSSTQLLQPSKEHRPLKVLRNDPEYQEYQKQRDLIEQRYQEFFIINTSKPKRPLKSRGSVTARAPLEVMQTDRKPL